MSTTSPSLIETVTRSLTTQPDEVEGPLDIVEGAVPEGLHGTLYRVVTGRMERGGVKYQHPFDGDGMMVRFAISPEGVHYKNRYVRTREFCEEEAQGRMLYRNFGTNLPGGLLANAFRMRFKNVANTSVVYHGGKLLALWEGGVPHRIDPVTLQTLDRDHFGGALLAPRSLLTALTGAELPFSAHPKIDPLTGDLYNFGTIQGYKPKLMLYRVSKSGRIDPPSSVVLDRLHFLHDFVLTRRHRVFLLSPVSFDVVKTLLGLHTPVESISPVRGEPCTALVLPREGGAPRFIKAPPCFVFHFANGYEDAEGRIVCDATRWSEYPDFGVDDGSARSALYEGPGPKLTRFTIDVERGTLREEQLSEHSAELPVIHPGRATQEHRYIWASGSGATGDDPDAQSVLKVDTVERTSTSRRFAPDLAGEPIFVPRPGGSAEDDGWVLVMTYVAALHRNELVALDARDLSTVFRARLPHHLPLGFHGTWVSAADAADASAHATN